MLHIYICDDIPEQLSNITSLVSDLILLKNWNTKITCATTKPEELLKALTPENIPGIYLLDIELNASIDGLELADKIRQTDPDGFLVFVTTHEECLVTTFHYHLETLDFIVKDSDIPLKDSLKRVLNTAYQRYEKRNLCRPDILTVKAGQLLHSLNRQDILYIESVAGTHQTRIYASSEQITSYESMHRLLELCGPVFFQCHKAYIVNLDHIISVDRKQKELLLDTGKLIPVSIRRMQELCRLLQH